MKSPVRFRLFLVLLLAAACLMPGCSRKTYPYNKKRKKRNCDCPEWSYRLPAADQNTLLLS